MDNKKKYGQFFTEPIIADFMTKISVTKDTKTFLDPAVGPGIFVQKAYEINHNLIINAYEIDEKMVRKYDDNIKFDTNLNNEDFLYSDENKYDTIVCNPPYNKFQEIPDRKKLILDFENKYGIKLSGYTNYCMYFLIKSLNCLTENGKCVFIIPYEFMNCGYGEIIKEYFLKTKMLKYLIKFNNDLKLFSDAMTTSCILFFENSIHNCVNFIEIKEVAELQEVLNEKYMNLKHISYEYDQLKSKEKWSKYFNKKNQIYKNLINFKEVAKVKRGIATGNNKYFTLNVDNIKKYNLSKNVCKPCVTKSSDVTQLIMTESYFNNLVDSNKKMFVFDGRSKSTTDDMNYISYGEEIGVNKSYLNSHRDPWYGIEDKIEAPIWISVFSRDKLKVVRNEMLIKNLTTFHGIYMNEEYKDYANILFCYLQTPIAQNILRMNKREYGEGLDKFEPNDINNAYILNLSILSKEDKTIIEDIYLKAKESNQFDFNLLNDIFLKYIEG